MENVRNVLIILFKCPDDNRICTEGEHKCALFDAIRWLKGIDIFYCFLYLYDRR